VTLKELYEQLALCSRCPLRANATAPVPGSGQIGVKYFIIGEAPGRNEDEAGMPFVGLAGKRLDRLLSLARIDINDCFLSNVCRCRPPANRTPRKSERISCYPWLKEELKLVKPKVIITLGALPLSLFTSDGIKSLHGTQFKTTLDLDGEVYEVTVIPQYHPAAALHQPRLWAVMLDDWENMPEKVDSSYIVVNEMKRVPAEGALDTENNPDGSLGVWSMAFRDASNQLCVQSFNGVQDKVALPDTVVMHNAKWDLRVLDANGMKRPKNVVDTMIAAYCLGLGRQDIKDTGRAGDQMVGGLGLKYLARRHLGMEMKSWQQVKDSSLEEIKEYNAADSVSTYLLWEKWKPKLPDHFWRIDMPMLNVCMAMEDRGIKVDPDFLRKYAEALDERLKNIDLPLNPFAPRQIADYVYNTLGIEPTKFTKTGQPSTEKEILETINDPIVRKILEYKEIQHERNTYVSSYETKMDLNHRIHCEFKQTSTTTSRLSSARPNLQNVTKDKEDQSSELRMLFVAEDGFLLVRVDFSQLELRVFAALTAEEAMLKALAEGRSIHQETADAIGVSYDDAKTVNFLMLYGGTAWAISREFHIPIDRAKALMGSYYRNYPGIKAYHRRIREQAENERKVSNLFGRVRRLDAMFSDKWKVREDGIREAINTPIQGTAAEIVKLAMIDLHYNHSAPMILQVHDEILFEVPENEAMEYAHWLNDYIPTITEINGVRFPVEVGVGRTWAESMKNKLKG